MKLLQTLCQQTQLLHSKQKQKEPIQQSKTMRMEPLSYERKLYQKKRNGIICTVPSM